MRVILMTALLTLGGCAAQSVQVYESTGEKQCEGGGLTLEDSRARLTGAGIEVFDSARGVQEGVAMIAVCGGPTPDIYIHRIKADDLDKARALGFEDLARQGQGEKPAH